MVRLDTALKALIDRVAKRNRQAASDWLRQAAIRVLRDEGEEIPSPPEED